MNLCLRYTKNETDALDVLNTGFYKVYKNIGRFNAEKASLYTWIRAIIINSCLDFIKTKQTLSGTGELEQAANIHVPPAAISNMSAAAILDSVLVQMRSRPQCEHRSPGCQDPKEPRFPSTT